MGNLNNLYISQSYQSLLHFATDTGSTATLTEIQDGTGQGLGLYLNSIGSASLNGDMYIGGDLTISGAIDIEGAIVIRDNVYVTGSIYSSQDISSSRMLTGEITASNMTIAGTLNVYKINTTIESSSVIFSSGSNILGDSVLDTQTLNGTTIMSGSSQLTGSMGITDNLSVLGNISSSTISGIGNVTAFSQSVDSRLDYLEGPFSTSVDFRLDQLENWSSSLQTNFATQAELTQTRSLIEGEMSVTASFLQSQIDQKLFTSSFNAYTASASSSLGSISASIAVTDNAQTVRINQLASFTGSYATTGSNTFIGNQTITGSFEITGSMVYSGSVRGQVFDLTIASQTASMDLSKGNFFTLTLPTGSTRLEATNIRPGETLSLRIYNSTSGSQLTGSTSVKFPNGFSYVPTNIAGTTDIITFLTFDTGSIYSVAANYFI